MLELRECQSLDTNNLPSAVYLSPVQTPPPSNNICENVCLLSFRRVTGLFDLGECLSLDGDNFPPAVHISPVQPSHHPTRIES